MLIVRLALVEFIRSCSRRAAGGRDFFWMLLLMVFLQLLALIILSAREGVLERSVDAFLGNRPGYGVPIWTVPNLLGSAQPVMITHDLVDEVTQAGYTGAPFRRISGGDLLRLPARELWTAPTDPFAGMAVDFSGPLHPQAQGVATLPDAWPIVLDERLFQDSFDLDGYRSVVQGRIPADDFALIPEDLADIAQMSVIWLYTRTGRQDFLTPFNVTWSRYFGVGDDAVAFLIPIEMYNAYRAGISNPGLCVFLDGGPDFAPRVRAVRSGALLGQPAQDVAAATQAVTAVAQPFGVQVQATRMRVSADFSGAATGLEPCDQGVPLRLFDALAAEAGVTLPADYVELLPHDPQFRVTATDVTASCATLSEDTLGKSDQSGEGAECTARFTTADVSNGFPDMVLYARGRLHIKSLVDYLTCRTQSGGGSELCVLDEAEGSAPESRLMINRIYEDALIRFGFLTELLRAISGPIGIALLMLLVAILWVQIGTVLGHRRVRYAMMLSNGISWGQLRTLAVIQTLTCTVVSICAAFVVFLAVKAAVTLQMAGITATYEMITFGRAVNVLPIHAGIVATVFVAMVVTALSLTVLQLRINSVSPHRALDRLLG